MQTITHRFIDRSPVNGLCDVCGSSAPFHKSPATTEPVDERCTHLSHCFQGEYPDTCKYGESDCPAQPVGEQAQPTLRSNTRERRETGRRPIQPTPLPLQLSGAIAKSNRPDGERVLVVCAPHPEGGGFDVAEVLERYAPLVVEAVNAYASNQRKIEVLTDALKLIMASHIESDDQCVAAQRARAALATIEEGK